MKPTEALKQFEKMCASLAQSYHTDGLELSDLLQEARLAVLTHLGGYSEDMGVSLQTFLGRRVRDALRSFRSHNLDLIEVERFWEARHISGDEEQDIRAATEEECEALRQRFGVKNYSRPQRVEKFENQLVSLDEEVGSDEDGSSLSRADFVRVEPTQEWAIEQAERRKLQSKIASNRIEAVRKNAEGKGVMSQLEKVVALRVQGLTQSEIAKALNLNQSNVSRLLSKLKKRVA